MEHFERLQVERWSFDAIKRRSRGPTATHLRALLFRQDDSTRERREVAIGACKVGIDSSRLRIPHTSKRSGDNREES